MIPDHNDNNTSLVITALVGNLPSCIFCKSPPQLGRCSDYVLAVIHSRLQHESACSEVGSASAYIQLELHVAVQSSLGARHSVQR